MKSHTTTILGIVRDGKAVIGGDGQVTLGDMVIKHKSKKVRFLANGKFIVGFAGAAADGMALLSRFEEKLTERCDLLWASVELAKEWRTDKVLRRLEAQLAAIDTDKALIITGAGDVLEPDDGIVALGSGSGYAMAAARALLEYGKKMSLRQIVERSLGIASQICIYTNSDFTILEL